MQLLRALQALLQLLASLVLTSAPAPSAAAAVTSRNRESDDMRLQLMVRSEVDTTGRRVLATRLVKTGSTGQEITLNVTEQRRRLQGGDVNKGEEDEVMLDAVVAVVREGAKTEMVTPVTAAPVTKELQRAMPTSPHPPLQLTSPALEVETMESPEELEPRQGKKRGPFPDGDFEEVKFSDYRPLCDTPDCTGLYKVVRAAATWTAARSQCEGDGAHLLVPETSLEARAAAKAFRLAAPPVGAQRTDLFFVGLSDSAREGHYVTVTGRNLTSMPFQRWHAREPSRGREQNGVALDVAGNLHDIPNAWRLAFMCEVAPAAAGHVNAPVT